MHAFRIDSGICHFALCGLYIKKYLDSIEKLLQTFNNVEREEAKASEVQSAVDEIYLILDLDTNGYEISTCLNQVNDKLAESRIFISMFLVFAMIIFRKQKCVFLNLIYMLNVVYYKLQNFDLFFS